MTRLTPVYSYGRNSIKALHHSIKHSHNKTRKSPQCPLPRNPTLPQNHHKNINDHTPEFGVNFQQTPMFGKTWKGFSSSELPVSKIIINKIMQKLKVSVPLRLTEADHAKCDAKLLAGVSHAW